MFRPTNRQMQKAAAEAFEPSYVFVYGTLKRYGAANDCMRRSGATYVGDTEIAGIELFLLPAGFPAAVIDPSGTAVAKGELWQVPRLYELDRLENNGLHYWRVKRSFPLNGETITAWIYLYLFPVRETDMPLVSGVYPVAVDDPYGSEIGNIMSEWATALGYKTQYGYEGFDDYKLDDPMCWEDCNECPYAQLGVTCVEGVTTLI